MVVYQFPPYDKQRAKALVAKMNKRVRKGKWSYRKVSGSWIVLRTPRSTVGRVVLRRMRA